MLILGGLTALAPLSSDMYLPSLPTVSHDLAATMPETQLTLIALILGLSLGQVIVGSISDTRGRRWPLLSSFAFAAGIVYISTSPFIFQNIYGLSPQIISYVFGVNALGLIILAQVSARLAGRVTP